MCEKKTNQWDVLIEASGDESEWVTVKETKQDISSRSVDETMMENIEGAVRMEGRNGMGV